MKSTTVDVIGGGLAGCEAALRLSSYGVKVMLYESKPNERSAAHAIDGFAEIVCSNSLKSTLLSTASGLLKAELKILNCRLLEVAESVAVPAGSALAVDRSEFSAKVSELIVSDPNIEIVSRTVSSPDFSKPTVIATGPLTLGGLSDTLSSTFGSPLSFYDAEAPIISADGIDLSKTFTASRYGKGGDDYINCPLNREEYYELVGALRMAERANLENFEERAVFEGCIPIEILASRGEDTLRFGPLRPVGFVDEDGNRPFAVVQLRRENTAGEAYNIVGFQTNLKFAEQRRVFGIIPALRNAEYLRYGVMHRNTFIDAPKIINEYFQTVKFPLAFIAGQLSGVEGYVESIASGLIAAENLYRVISGKEPILLPQTTVIGGLCRYLATPNGNFQPMNANFGLLPPITERIRDKNLKKTKYSERAICDLKEFVKSVGLTGRNADD